MRRLLAQVVIVANLGCAGAGVSSRADSPGPTYIRRLTRVEYDNTVRDLLGDTTLPARDFAPEDRDRPLGFSNNAAVMGVTTLLGEQLMSAAEGVAARATQRLSQLMRCARVVAEDECARRFVANIARRAWRRPLARAEVDDLLALYAAGKTRAGFRDGIRLALVALLQAPEFLYRIEVGEGAADAGGALRLTPWELATRLSYLMWNSMPDDELFAAAESGGLRRRGELLRQARRMLADPRAGEMIATFHAQWLALDELGRLEKSPRSFGAFRRGLGDLFRRETELYVDEVVNRRGGGIEALLTSPFTFVDRELAAFYDLPAPEGDGFARVATDGRERAGLLTQASFLAREAKHDQTSPVLRGKFVREQLLCTPPPPPPPNVNNQPPEVSPKLTTRERFEEHRADVGCRRCHKLMDPLGLGFENYDGVGRWRSAENGKPIDAEGEVVDSDVAGPFVGAVELSRKLAASRQVRRCYVTQWFRFAFGRNEIADDGAVLDHLERKYVEGGRSARALILAMTQTDTFAFRAATARTEHRW